ncbi:MAG: peptide-methionine (S)-S-oxide reductase MsrA [Methanobrevibacter thaueri]|nr:peptide-methionine (S)-S-oxide reductase MsrA [Methanobrevibacter thaueri]
MFVKQNVIYLAGGCFWGVEAFISRLSGVNRTEVGYANGHDLAPTYEKVSGGKTGHAECVKVTYNPEIISLDLILENFFKIIDPFSVNCQGEDVGSQYRSGIYWQEDFQRSVVVGFLKEKQKLCESRIVVEVGPICNFYLGEEYHQKYLEKHPDGYCHIDLNLIDDEKFSHLTREEYEITQLAMTEPAFSGEYNDFFEDGIYVDVVDGEVLFASEDKIKTDTGWASFKKPIDENKIIQHRDYSHGTTRIEIRSKKANTHLGHIHYEKNSKIYCINSASLKFIPE